MAEFTHKCPYCNQELLLEDDWAGQAIACPKCNNSVIVPDRQKNRQAIAERNAPSRFSSAFCIDKSYRKALEGFCTCGYISVIAPLVLFAMAFCILADKEQTGGGIALLAALLSIPLAILGVWAVRFTSDLKKPYKKITYSKKTDALLIIYGIINGVICLLIAYAAALSMNIASILVIIAAVSGAFSILRVRTFYKLRAEEDADYTEEEIAAEKDNYLRSSNSADVSITVRAANALSIGSFVPLAGWLFIPLAIILTVIAIKRGFMMVKSITFIIIGCIINSIALIIYANWNNY